MGLRIHLILVTLVATWCASGSEDVAYVLEGQDVTLKCRIPRPLSDGVQVYWMGPMNGTKDNYAIGNITFSPEYKVDFRRQEGWYDLTITRATYERNNGMFQCRVKEEGTGFDLHTSTVNLTVLIKPGSPRISPLNPTAIEGQTLDITCSSQGGSPDPDIDWYRVSDGQKMRAIWKPGGGRDFPTTSVLTIRPTKDDDGAEYMCEVRNKAMRPDEKTAATVRLNVQYFPVVTILPSNPVRVEKGKDAELTCTADAKPAVQNVKWSRKGTYISTDNTYLIKNANQDDAGRYICRATNGLGSPGEAEVTVDVQYGPIVRAVPKQEVRKGDSIIVTCNVSANPQPVSIQWLKEGDYEFKQTGPVLQLSRVTAEDQGNYVCRAVNVLNPTYGDGGSREGNATVQVRVYHPPGKSYITPSRPVVAENKQAMLTCQADPPGYPEPRYRWWRDTVQSSVVYYGENYTISIASMKDEGTYYCQPFNDLGNGSIISTQLKVYQPPRILDILQINSPIQRGATDFSLSCQAQGKPEPSIQWVKDSQEISMSDGLYTIKVEQSAPGSSGAFTVLTALLFQGSQRMGTNQVMAQDRGTYKCIFKNEAGEASYEQLLRVQHPPITAHKQNKVAFDINEDAIMECRMQAYPAPTFGWLLNTNPVQSDKLKYIINDTSLGNDLYSSTLTIRSIQPSDYGSYTCKGINDEGSRKTKIHLQKKGLPEAPENLKLMNRGTTFLELSWEEGFNGGYIDTKFFVQVASEDATWEDDCQFNTTCTIANLKQQVLYRLRVRAHNKQGFSEYSNTLEAVTLLDSTSIPKPEEVFFEKAYRRLSFKSPSKSLKLKAHVDVHYVNSMDWNRVPEEVELFQGSGTLHLQDDTDYIGIRVQFCSIEDDAICGPHEEAQKVDSLASSLPSMGGHYLIVTVVACIAGIAMLAIIFICCCRRRNRNTKLKNKQADMEVSHRGVTTPQVPPPPYYTVGVENKGMDGSVDRGLDDHGKGSLYSSPQYQNYGPNGHILNIQNNNGYMDNSYSNSNNGGSVNSQDSLWQVKSSHSDPSHTNQLHQNDPRAQYQYDPMMHGSYGISGFDDYAQYPPVSTQGNVNDDYIGNRGNYNITVNGDPYASVHKQRNRMDHIDGGYDVSGMPDPYMDHHTTSNQGIANMTSDSKPSFDESLESEYSTPNSRNRRIIREIIV